MAFHPNPGDRLQIGGVNYIIGTHPVAPGMAYAQAGRQGVVYQLIPENGEARLTMALKIFLPKFRLPSRVHLSQTMEEFSQLQGLKVCKREVLTPERNGELIAEYPDLLYAVLMPWIHGGTWMDVLGGRETMSPADSLHAARLLSSVGSAMEQRGIAHCDLSAPNVMFTGSGPFDIELVDVEQMFSPRLDPPDLLLGGSPGYASARVSAHHPQAAWNAYADRFPGAVMMAEMLGWCDPEVRGQAWGESYFDPEEMQRPCERYQLLNRTLEDKWGKEIAELFARAWGSGDSRFCPTFGEWVIALTKAAGRLQELEQKAAVVPHQEAAKQQGSRDGLRAMQLLPEANETDSRDHEQELAAVSRFGTEQQAALLTVQARKQEQEGKTAEALNLYLQAQKAASQGSHLYVEVTAAVEGLLQVLKNQALNHQAGQDLEQVSQAENLGQGEAEQQGGRWKITGAPKAAAREKSAPMRIRSRRLLWWGSGIAAAVLVLVLGLLLTDHESSGHQPSMADSPAASPLPTAGASTSSGTAQVSASPDDEGKDEAQEEAERLAAAKAEQERQAKIKAALQKQYDQQAAYNKYLEWKKKKELLQAQEKAAAEEAARKAAEKKAAEEEERKKREAQQAKQAAQLKAVRDQKAMKMIAYYNSAYNAQMGGHRDMAEKYCRDFLEIYNTDAQYFVKTGAIGKRVGHIYKYLQNTAYTLPDV
ncbi:hypothetical protein AWM70_05580 [Paenibacillus yonginensis]|uniref:Protein kinase domain-containing protein n=1 Tax=Paenibacillus yonginensis TaxID=1462996 RepID=A0A1B1MY50_9BACL|nr:hypothetical protein [Paenibacillus yonginensis]ANS74112.1 hypothetical protein AWM70_05580 [Paenibacillus yonginensis]